MTQSFNRIDLNSPKALFSRDVTVILGDPRLADSAKRGAQFNPEDFEAFDRMKKALEQLQAYHFTYLDNHRTLLSDLLRNSPRFAFNLCDTGYENVARRELHIPAMLEMLGIPYSGAGPVCLALCYDKALVRAIAARHNIPVPVEVYWDAANQPADIALKFPALIKPNCGDGSIGITRSAVVDDAEQARAYLENLRMTPPHADLLIQEFLSGAEYSIGLIGNPALGFIELPPLEVDYGNLDPALPRILAYESKADPESPYWQQITYCETEMDASTRRRLFDYSKVLFERVGCRDYARFDFRTDENGEIKFLEVNPNAAWCWDGKLNLMAGFAGYDYAGFLHLILQAAQARVAAAQLD